MKKSRRLKRGLKRTQKKVKHVERSTVAVRKELSQEAFQQRSALQHEMQEGRSSQRKTRSVKERLAYDITVHKLEGGAVKDALTDVDDISCAIKDVKTIIETARKVQKKQK